MKEQERKFLLLNLPKEANKPDLIKTADIVYEDGKCFIVKIINNRKAYLIYTNSEGKKFQYQIPIHDGVRFYTESEQQIECLSHKLVFKGNLVEITIYDYQEPTVFGIVTIEYETELKPDEIPYYCGTEITQ